jgi:GDSL-like Lipase/Acylhydrolase family
MGGVAGNLASVRMGRLTLRICSAIAAVAVVLVVAELSLRLISTDLYRVWEPGLHRVFRPLPEAMPGIHGDGHFRTSVDGLRGDAIDDAQDYRLLAIGGSTTESLYLDDSEVWTHLLQRRLNEAPGGGSIWVGNAGKSGHTTRHHRLQVARLLPQHPGIDAILVLAGINDFLRRLARDDEWMPMESPEALSPDAYDLLMRQAFAVHPG